MDLTTPSKELRAIRKVSSDKKTDIDVKHIRSFGYRVLDSPHTNLEHEYYMVHSNRQGSSY